MTGRREPAGWNVYRSGIPACPVFDHFEPNEPVLLRVAAEFADEVERSLGGEERA